MMRIGIEHEFVFKDNTDKYLDFNNSKYALFQKIVAEFPYIENDNKVLECKSLEDRPKRCYVEGFERYDIEGNLLETTPKGIEIRTMPYSNVDEVIDDFKKSFRKIMHIAKKNGLSPLLTSVHPYKTSVTFQKPLNQIEIDLRTDDERQIAINAMLGHRLHVNVSISDFSKKQMIDLVQKVNYYAPFILPYSFSSPFCKGEVFEGLSYQTYRRAATRRIIQLQNRKGVYVLEFRGFDACGDAQLLKSLLLLFKGLLLDKTLTKRSLTQDSELLKRSSLQGFADQVIKEEGLLVLNAIKSTLREEGNDMKLLKNMLQTNDSYSVRMKRTYQETGDIIKSISDRYTY